MAPYPRYAFLLFLGGAIIASPPAEGSGTELECTAAGYDVLLKNPGPETLAQGTQVAWDVKFVRHSGELTLTEALEPGDSVFVSGALGSDYLSSPQPCTATAGES